MRTMRRKLLLVAIVGLTAMGGFVRASRAAEDGDEEERREPVRHIKVLENPYDIASFYRSSQGEGYGYWGPGPGYEPYDYFGEPGERGRYPIASYYRNDLSPGPGGYSRFWTFGYSSGYRRANAVVSYRRSIGQNGDLFLMTPFLAPVGPLTGVFFEGR